MDGDGGFVVDIAGLMILLFWAAALITVYFILFKVSRNLYRQNKVWVLAPWIPAFPSVFWLLYNLTLPDNYPQYSTLTARILALTPFYECLPLLLRFPIPMIAYFVIAYGSLVFLYFHWKQRGKQVLNKEST
jgi:hypothetical protein